MKLLGFALLALGVLALVYGGFWYPNETTKAEIGPLKVTVQEDKHVNVPVWAGVLLIAVGGVIVGTRSRLAA
jgi:uncharacterized membrane protein